MKRRAGADLPLAGIVAYMRVSRALKWPRFLMALRRMKRALERADGIVRVRTRVRLPHAYLFALWMDSRAREEFFAGAPAHFKGLCSETAQAPFITDDPQTDWADALPYLEPYLFKKAQPAARALSNQARS